MNSLELTEVQNKLSNLDYLLDRKLFLLEEVLKIAVEQSITFKSTLKSNSEEANTKIQKDIDEKQALIDELISIDDMFISIFKSFSGILNQNPNVLRKEIILLQNKIKSISQIDLKIRVQEDKNKQLFSNMNIIKNSMSSNMSNGVSSNMSKDINNNISGSINNNKSQSLLNKYQQNNIKYNNL